ERLTGAERLPAPQVRAEQAVAGRGECGRLERLGRRIDSLSAARGPGRRREGEHERDEGEGAGFVGGESHRWNRSTRAAASGTRTVHQDRRARRRREWRGETAERLDGTTSGRDGPTPSRLSGPCPGWCRWRSGTGRRARAGTGCCR